MTTPEQLRRAVAELTDTAQADLATLFRQARNPEQAREAMLDVLPALVDAYWLAAATTGADWYDDLREQHEVPGRFRSIVPDQGDLGAATLVDWAISTATDMASLESLVAGGLQKRIANGSRATVMDSALADPRADGWMRVGIGACRFCQMLISRGAIYSESSVRFGAHDHDRCQAAPSWGRPSDIFDVDEYRRSLRNRSDETREADSARAREWIAEHL